MTTPPRPEGQAPSPPEPVVRGESLYDRVTSFLMAVVVGALLVVGWLALVYATNQAYASRVTAPLEIVEVFGGGGGSPDGTAGSTEKIDGAGAGGGAPGSNKKKRAGGFVGAPAGGTPRAVPAAAAGG